MEKNKIYIQMVLDSDELHKKTQQDKNQNHTAKLKEL